MAKQHFVRPAKRASVLQRDDKYRANTPQEAWMTVEDAIWQAHHIVCNHSVGQANIDQALDDAGIDKTYGNDVLWITPWDLNDGDNMMGLPTNWQHRLGAGKDPENLPSHQVDHNTTGGYTEECTGWLKGNVWNKVKDKGKSHEANAGNMQTVLKGASKYFRGQLKKRGTRPGKKGTAYCWAHRFEKPPATASAAEKKRYKQEEEWYMAFSMAEDSKVNKRAPGLDWSESFKSVAEALKKITTT